MGSLLTSHPPGFPANSSGGNIFGGSAFSIKFGGTTSTMTTTGFAGAITLAPIDLPVAVTFAFLAALVTNVNAGNSCDWGLYTENGKLVCNVGLQLASFNGIEDLAIVQGKITLPAGRYLFALYGGNIPNAAAVQVGIPATYDYTYTCPAAGLTGLPATIVVTKSGAIGNSGMVLPILTFHL
jgi:hypothetical protein